MAAAAAGSARDGSQGDGEMWTRGDARAGTGIGQGRPAAVRDVEHVATAIPRAPVRLPSENNPWSVEPRSAFRSASPMLSRHGSANVMSGGRPAQNRGDSWGNTGVAEGHVKGASSSMAGTTLNSEPDRQASYPSLADLSLVEDRLKDSGRVAISAGSGGTGPTKLPMLEGSTTSQAQKDKEMIEAAMGGDQKAWDPLGAL
jgi:hypothetical protein